MLRRLTDNPDFKEFIEEIKNASVAERVRDKYASFYKDDVEAAKDAMVKKQ